MQFTRHVCPAKGHGHALRQRGQHPQVPEGKVIQFLRRQCEHQPAAAHPCSSLPMQSHGHNSRVPQATPCVGVEVARGIGTVAKIRSRGPKRSLTWHRGPHRTNRTYSSPAGRAVRAAGNAKMLHPGGNGSMHAPIPRTTAGASRGGVSTRPWLVGQRLADSPARETRCNVGGHRRAEALTPTLTRTRPIYTLPRALLEQLTYRVYSF